MFLKSQARYKEAEQAFAQASELAPSASMPLANLGMMYVLQKQDLAAESKFREALAKSRDEIALIGLGDLRFAAGNYSEALTFYLEASRVNPNNPSAFRDMGDCFIKLSQPDQVAKNYKIAADLVFAKLQRNPALGEEHARLAFYDAKSGNSFRAVQDLSKARDLGANDIDSDFYKVQALAILGRKKEALGLLLKCLDRGLSSIEVDGALDLTELASDPQYKQHLSRPETPLPN